MEDNKVLGRTFCADLKMGLGVSFVLAIFGVFICFCFDNWDSLRNLVNTLSAYGKVKTDGVICVMYYFFNSFSFGGVFSQYFAPIMATIPFSMIYCHETEGGISIYKISRCGSRIYGCSKFLVASILGGMTLLLGGLVFILALRTCIPMVTPMKLCESEWIPFFHALTIGDGTPYMAIVLYISFLSGALWGSAGLCTSAYFPSSYVTICAPFIFRFVLVQIGRLLKLPNGLRLEMLLSARGKIYSDTVTIVVTTAVVLVLIYLCYRLFVSRIERRIWDVE